MDAAGVIETAGADVKNIKSGDRVITRIGFDVSKYGAHGETAILPAQFVIKYPEFLSSSEAASIFVPYLSAWGALNDFGQIEVYADAHRYLESNGQIGRVVVTV